MKKIIFPLLILILVLSACSLFPKGYDMAPEDPPFETEPDLI